jgi:4-carboxymuconolactone decarboxylase
MPKGGRRALSAPTPSWLDVESKDVLVRLRSRTAARPECVMSRLPDLPYDEMTAEQQRVYDEIAAGPRGKVIGPLKVWLHSPQFADRAQKLGAYLRYHSALPAELSELAILVTARLWQADFEWYSHVGPARAAGIPDAVIEAVRVGAEPALEDPKSRAVYAVACELHEARALSDQTYAHAEAALGREGLVDLVGLLGYYTLISMTLKAFDVPSPGGSHPFGG